MLDIQIILQKGWNIIIKEESMPQSIGDLSKLYFLKVFSTNKMPLREKSSIKQDGEEHI